MPNPIRGAQIATGADGIDTANLVDSAVTTAKINDLAVTTAKIGANQVTDAKVDATIIIASGGNPFTGDQAMGNNKITGLADGTAANDAVNKGQLDSAAAGVDPKESVRLATDAALPANTPAGSGIGKTLTGDVNGALTVDGVAVLNGNRVIVKDEGGGTSVHNGIYTQTQLGTGGAPFILTRATDADEDAEVTASMYAFCEEGTTNADTGWLLLTNDPIVVDTTALTFTQFTGLGIVVAGGGLTKTGNTIDVGAGNGITVNADDVEVDYALVGAITSVDAGDAAAAGVANTAARGDHQHAVSTGAAIAAQVGQANSEGGATTLARSNHTHQHTAGSPVGLGNANATGAATTFNASDHVHKRDVQRQEALTTELITSSDTALADTLDAVPTTDGSVKLFLNGVQQNQGAGRDYSISGQTITWLASSGTAVNMQTNDTLEALYDSAT